MKYFDLHCDTLGFCSGREKDILSGEFHVDLDKNEFESWVQAFAVFIIDDMRGEKGFNAVKKAYEYLNKLCENHPDLVKKVNTYKDIEEASKIGACAAMFTLEGGSGIGDKIENVENHLPESHKAARIIFVITTDACCRMYNHPFDNMHVLLAPAHRKGGKTVAEKKKYDSTV